MQKNLLIIATGGTIASNKTKKGLSPTSTGDDLISQIAGLPEDCRLHVLQLMNIDSTNMKPDGWMAIQKAIAENYDTYDGFVVLHGTDTLDYTAAALSYLIQNSPKPIVITGSQKPMSHPYTDAKINLYQSILYALDSGSCDVSVVFGGRVIAGTRSRKQKTRSFDGFTSMNFPLLARFQDEEIIRVFPADKPFGPVRFYDHLEGNILSIKLMPGMTPDFFRLLKEQYQGIILEAYGLGGIPNFDRSYEEAIFDWIHSGKILVITTQVPEEGCDFSVYEVGHIYHNHPLILEAGNMTLEAISAKLMWALGQTKELEKIRELFYRRINFDC